MGPLYVRFEVIIDDNRQLFDVELAPIDIMPHAVNVFLNMVASEVWNDSIFLHRAHHIIQAIPIDSKGNGDEKKKIFESSDMQMSFPEYDSSYPHNKYTLGFSGRPGGPEFYISTQDNAEYHGPRGQSQYEMAHDADPCFGKVIRGHDVVDRMNQLNEIAAKKIEEGDDKVMFTSLQRVYMISD